MTRRDIFSDALIAAGIILGVTTAWLLVLASEFSDIAILGKQYPYIALYGWLIFISAAIWGRFLWRRAIASVMLLVLVSALVIDLTSLRYFRKPYIEIHRYLPVSANDATPEILLGYATSYIAIEVVLIAFAAVAFGFLLSRHSLSKIRVFIVLAIAPSLAFLIVSISSSVPDRESARLAELLTEPDVYVGSLHFSDRSANYSVEEARHNAPETIVFVLLESASADIRDSGGDGLLSEWLIRRSGADGWVSFPDAITTSNATDIAVPSLLTGAGSHEKIDKLHSLPFISEMAGALGYETHLITSSTLEWGGFRDFLEAAKFDQIVTGDDLDEPYVNDVAIDDAVAYTAAAEKIEQSKGKLFLTLYPQALHWPFQTESKFAVAHEPSDRIGRATAITQSGMTGLFRALRASGRLDDALIVIVGDHGEFDYSSALRMPKMRLDTFDEGILSPIYLVKAPNSMSRRHKDALRANANSMVASHDLAPTLAELLGIRLERGLSYDGYSLLRDVPEDRIVYSTSVNEWRGWPTAAIAVSQGPTSMVCDTKFKCVAKSRGATSGADAGSDHPLFEAALDHPVMRYGLRRIYEAD